ncbi:MAG: RluA family pseudouridine synthase [Planctomycetota bacterium]|nr:RluA family pseudouridine synthase [Planctomycetota bacterium]
MRRRPHVEPRATGAAPSMREPHPGTDRDFVVTAGETGLEIAALLVFRFPGLSKRAARHLAVRGKVTVNADRVAPHLKVRAGDRIVANIPTDRLDGEEAVVKRLEPGAVLYEDEAILVIDKPSGVSVLAERDGSPSLFDMLRKQSPEHPQRASTPGACPPPPTAGTTAETDGDATGARASSRDQSDGGRPGTEAAFYPHVVHRLDKETSGVIVFGKSTDAMRNLSGQFEKHEVEKRYVAFVSGSIRQDKGSIDFPIGEHPRLPGRMVAVADARRLAVRDAGSTETTVAVHVKPAATEFQVVERFSRHTLLHVWPRTGRTHQVRVHLAAIGHPVVADRLYGGREPLLLSSLKAGYKRKQDDPERPLISRLALHAQQIEFVHPQSGMKTRFESPLPKDMSVLIRVLRKYCPR